MTRDELIDAGARAFYEAAYGSQYADQAMRRRLAPHMNAVLDAVEPLIRADERELVLDIADLDRAVLDGFRAKVMALPTTGSVSQPRLYLDRADVLALFDGADR